MKFFLFAARVIGIGFICAGGAHAATPGVDDHSILLGQSAAFSGFAAPLGESIRDGAKLYFDEVNRNGGVHGRRINLLSLDDGYWPDQAIANTRLLIEDNAVFALFGYVGTQISDAVGPIATKAKVPFYGAFTEADGQRRRAGKYVLDLRAGYNDETETLIDFLVSHGKRRIAVFYQDDAHGEAGLTDVQKEMEKRELPIVATGTVEPDTKEVGGAVNVIAMSDPDAVILVSAHRFSDAFIKEMNKTESTPEYYNVSSVEPDGVAAERGFNDLEGYRAAKTFVDGLRRAGPDLTREKFVQTLASHDRDEGHLRFTEGEFVPVLSVRDPGDDYLRVTAEFVPVLSVRDPGDDYLRVTAEDEFVPVRGVIRAAR